MGRSRGITLKGEAARAFVEGAMGRTLKEKPLTEADKRLVVATKVSMLMRSGTKADAELACDLLKTLEDNDLESAFELQKSF